MTEAPPPDGHPTPRRPKISFEFFPPKTEEMEKALWESIARLSPLAPNFQQQCRGYRIGAKFLGTI